SPAPSAAGVHADRTLAGVYHRPAGPAGARTKPASSSSRIVMMVESSSLRTENSDPSLSLGRLAVYTPRPKPRRSRRRLPGRPRIRRGPKEVALAGTVLLRSA